MLFGVALAGLVQVANADPAPSAEIVAEPASDAASRTNPTAPPTTLPPPFVYRIGVLAGIDTANFWDYYGRNPSVWNSYILGPTKPALYMVDPVTGRLEPELIAAEVTPTWNSDGWSVSFDLSQEYAWSDGTPISAKDVAFTFQTVRDLELGGSWARAFPEEIAAVDAEGEFKVRIEFTGRPDLSVWPYGVGQAPIMPRHAWEEIAAEASAKTLYEADSSIDVSGGPLALDEVSDTMIISHSNPGYPDAPGPETVEYHVFSDEASLVDAMADGVIDTLLTPKGLAPDHAVALGEDSSVATQTSPANGVRYLGFNLSRDPMSQPEFRQALALLIDREALATEIPQSGEAAWSLIPEANAQWYDHEAVAAIKNRYSGTPSARFAEAIKVLKAVGYSWTSEPKLAANGAITGGKGLTIDSVPPQPLTILTPGDAYDPARPQYVARIADILSGLGFDARPVETDFDTVVELAFTPGDDGAYQYDMYFLGWTLGNPALPGFHRQFFTGDLNNTGYASEAFDTALARYEAAFSTLEAKEAVWNMERAIAADLPYLPLYTSELTEVYRSDTVQYAVSGNLGGLQARLGGIGDVSRAD